MDVVYAWSQGARFVDICELTDEFEGSIIRAMRRLEVRLRAAVSSGARSAPLNALSHFLYTPPGAAEANGGRGQGDWQQRA